ncbi:hypothetical protein GIB67_031926, partial [Kingdonia uniflora]
LKSQIFFSTQQALIKSLWKIKESLNPLLCIFAVNRGINSPLSLSLSFTSVANWGKSKSL